MREPKDAKEALSMAFDCGAMAACEVISETFKAIDEKVPIIPISIVIEIVHQIKNDVYGDKNADIKDDSSQIVSTAVH